MLISSSLASPKEKDLFIVISAGWFDFVQQTDEAIELNYEIRVNKGLLGIKPLWGLTTTSDGAFHVYLGLWADIHFFSNSIVITPSFSPCFVQQGEKGKTLYSTTQFKSQVELSFILQDESRINIILNHISNAGITKLNPGVETIGISYLIPVENIF